MPRDGQGGGSGGGRRARRAPEGPPATPSVPLNATADADLVAIVVNRDKDDRISTVVRRYPVKPVAAVPAEAPTKDVEIDYRSSRSA